MNFDKVDFHYTNSPEYPDGRVEMEVNMDDATYRRYLSSFGLYERKKNNKGIHYEMYFLKNFFIKGMPPNDWLEGSKSYFERKNKPN